MSPATLIQGGSDQQLSMQMLNKEPPVGVPETARKAAEGDKELRGACLRLLARMWQCFPDAVDWQPLWPSFFDAAAALLPRMEAGTHMPATCVRPASCSVVC